MEFFTLITQVLSQFDHTDIRTGQVRKDELILTYGRKCLEKKHGCHTWATHELSDLTHNRRVCVPSSCVSKIVSIG